MLLVPDSHSILDPRDAHPEARRLLTSWLALQAQAGLHPQAARQALEQEGYPESARAGLPGRAPPAAELEARRNALARCGARGVPWGSPLYPEALAALPDAPPLLWVRGDPARLAGPIVALVGARAASAYGRAQARRLASELAAAGLAVVSGLARGVDGEAHRGALAAGGVTLAVLGCGVDRVHPPAHRSLAERIVQGGAVVSELSPGAPPLAHHFPLRNRLISGLSRAVVVVEARERSGSLITARHAADQGREVLAVPGPVDAPTSRGTNLLLRDGAAPALDASDVLRAIGWCPVMPAPSGSEPPERLPAELRRLLEELPATRDELLRRLGLSPQQLAPRLLALELEGRLVEDADGRLRALSPPARA